MQPLGLTKYWSIIVVPHCNVPMLRGTESVSPAPSSIGITKWIRKNTYVPVVTKQTSEYPKMLVFPRARPAGRSQERALGPGTGTGPGRNSHRRRCAGGRRQSAPGSRAARRQRRCSSPQQGAVNECPPARAAAKCCVCSCAVARLAVLAAAGQPSAASMRTSSSGPAAAWLSSSCLTRRPRR